LTPTLCYSEKPKFLIIELKGYQEHFDYLQEAVNYDLSMSHLMEFFSEQFRSNSQALLNLDYSLMELYAERNLTGRIELTNDLIVNESRKLGLILLKFLEKLGCFQNDKLDYTFAQVLEKDTFMFWRPHAVD